MCVLCSAGGGWDEEDLIGPTTLGEDDVGLAGRGKKAWTIAGKTLRSFSFAEIRELGRGGWK